MSFYQTHIKCVSFIHICLVGKTFSNCIFSKKQNLGTVLKCYSLGSPLKILFCGFFLMDGNVFFKLNNHITEF